MADWIGKTLGKVRIELLLARGGMAEVYLGMHTTLQKPVAVKLLRTQFLDDPDLLNRFQKEARVAASLRHSNIVQVFDYDTHNGQPYLVMEYIHGVTLSTYLHDLQARGEKLDLMTIRDMLERLASALEYAHDSGVIHRDVKPGNILLNSRSHPVEKSKPLPYDVQPVLTDFGLLRLINTNTQTSAGQIAGTPHYMSPEQARGDKTDSRTDIYSLGIVLYEMLAGRVPFDSDTSMGVLLKHISKPPDPIPGLAPALQQVINRVLSKKPEDRYQTPMELSRAFTAALRAPSQEPTIAPSKRNPGLSQVSAPGNKRPRAINLIAFFGVAAVALLAAFYFLRGGFFVPAPTASPTSMPEHSAETQVPVAQVNPEEYTELATHALVRFQNGAATADRATVTALEMLQPSQGSQYEVWLIGEAGESRRSLGRLDLDSDGKGSLSYVDSQGRNLIALYDTVEITIEPEPDSNPNPTDQVAYRSSLPPEGLTHSRHLLVAFGSTPNNLGLVHGLLQETTKLDQLAHDLLSAQEAGQPAEVRKNAERMINLLVGSQSPDYRDWDQDGNLEDVGDGFGLLLNGDNIGYIEGTFSHASYAATANNATEDMIMHGLHVEVCSQNMEQWAPLLRNVLLKILSGNAGPGAEPQVRQAVALADELLEGTDLNGNEQVEPVPGEGGARTAYQHAYYMVDIELYDENK